MASDIPRNVQARIQLNGGDYKGYVESEIDITTEMTTYAYTFEMEDSDPLPRLCFNIGKPQNGDQYDKHKVMIDNVYTGPTDVWYTHTMKSMTLTKPTDETVLEDIRWYIEYPNGSTQTAHGGSVVVRPTTAGTLKVTATYINGCNDEYESQTRTYSIVSLFNMTFTNPASGSVDVNVTNGDVSNESDVQTMSLNNQQTPYMGAYRLELWHDLYGKVREIDVAENTPTVTMNLDGLNSGVYILRLIIDNQIITAEQLIVK
jgi:hypothetical protein